VKFEDGTVVPALGQGSWHLAEGRHPESVEEEALRTGLSLGMTLIDTAEMYSNGRSEELIGRVIASQRDRVFLVSKVLPNHTTGDGIARACEGSLARLGTDYLDLYLLHWRNSDLWRRSKVCVRRGRYAPGACPTSRSATWKIFSVCQMAIDAPPIRSVITSTVVALKLICCRGASNAACL
jgi:diketogulonate reductase-like aldo/keto reductase